MSDSLTSCVFSSASSCASTCTPAAPAFHPAQRRLWRIEQGAGAPSKPNEVLCVDLEGAPSRAALVALLDPILDDNPQYHSTLDVQGGLPCWRPGARSAVPVFEAAIGPDALPEPRHDELGAFMDRLYQSERAHAFDLATEFPLRITIARQAASDTTCLVLTFHRFVMTRAQLELVFERLKSALTGRAERAPAAPGRAAAAASAAAASGAPPRPSAQPLPTDRPRGAPRDFASARYEFAIDRHKIGRLRALLNGACLPQQFGIMALFAIGAARLARRQSVQIGVAHLPRAVAGALAVETLFDHYPVQARLDDGVTFLGLAAALENAYAARGAVPLETLLEGGEHDGHEGASACAPFCQLAFEYRHPDLSAICNDGGAPSRRYPREPASSVSHSDIELKVRASLGGGLHFALEYASALFERATMVRFAHELDRLLGSVLANPYRALAELEAADAPDAASTPGAPLDTLDGLFRAQALAAPDAVALIDGALHLGYGALEQAAASLAARLAQAGIRPGDRIGLYLPRSADYVVCVLAVLRCGALFVPLDTGLPLARIHAIDGGAGLALVLHAGAAISGGHWKRIDQLPAATAGAAPSGAAQAAAYVMYTSGSSGAPKGVIGGHAGAVNRVRWAGQALGQEPDDLFCMKSATGFVDHVAEMFQPLLTGRALVILSEDTVRDARAMVERLAQYGVTRLTVAPFVLARLAEQPGFARLRALRSVACSGDALDAVLARRFFNLLPGVRLFNIYGLTETGADSSCYEVPDEPRHGLPDHFRSAAAAATAAAARTARGGDGERITLPGVSLDQLKERFLDPRVPATPVSAQEYFAWMERDIVPYSVNVASRKFIGHMTSALPDFMPEISALVARLNQNMVKIETSKSLTFLERQTLAMLHREFYGESDYTGRIQDPHNVFGLVVSGGSSANITAMWNARNAALLELGFSKAEISEQGAFELARRRGYEGFAIIASGLAHYSIRKAAAILGIGERNILVLKQDAQQKADLADLEASLRLCGERKLLPVAVIAIAGATETGTIDPIAAMAEVAARHGVHFHVDAAWGGAMIFSERYRGLLDGIERADSITLCPHKQLFVPQGISVCLLRDPKAIHASSVQAVYQGQSGSFDMGQYTIEGSRPAIFLALHAMLHIMTGRGIGALVDQGIDAAAYFAGLVAAHPAFELVGSPQINILNYRYIPMRLRHKEVLSAADNAEISRAVAAIQQQQFLQGKTFVSKTDVRSQRHGLEKITVFRVVISNPLTGDQDLLDNLANQLEIADALVEGRAADGQARQSIAPALAGERAGAGAERHLVPIGRPIANTEILVLDGAGRLLPDGAEGELYVGGAGLALGYLHGEDAGDAFVAHPFRPGQRLYRTGDFGLRLAGGELAYSGRRDRQVKVRGVKVQLAEVEACLARLPEVAQCAVVAGQRAGDATLEAWVVPRAGRAQAGAVRQAIRRQLLAVLPAPMVPQRLHLVASLPLAASGKVDRGALAAQLPATPAAAAGAPPSATEERLLRLCRKVLGREQLAIGDNFFDIGGHSMAAASLQQEIRSEFAVELSYQSFYVQPCLADIAGMIDELQAALV
ncbi:AMP-binding protein [Massilia sp. CFBP 13721]|uniref:AMP-binding protein n=1 Tax=Massilia sp. CFBP 13721 TaxID=2775300 RepID=UPI00178524E9|nr:AMP-binding protein [Massilia sp. CFBP 13721]MBD8673894.1 aminotransferase class V-fold PLP-dependent enzyme [Massilia sp. CFBP 13721]